MVEAIRRAQATVSRRRFIRTAAEVAAGLSAVAVSWRNGLFRAGASTTWILSVPRTDEVTQSWHSTNSKYLDINDCSGTAVNVLVKTGVSTYGRVKFSEPVLDCGTDPEDRRIVNFELLTDGSSTISTGRAQHIRPATWQANTIYDCPITVGFIDGSGTVDQGCWTGSHVHYGADMTTTGSFSANTVCGHGQTVTYDSDYPWSKII
jgi:hypothetical protein